MQVAECTMPAPDVHLGAGPFFPGARLFRPGSAGGIVLTSPLAASRSGRPVTACRSMKLQQLTVVGVGLIGGSVAQAARLRGVARRVVGIEQDAAYRDRAIA